MSRHLWRTQCQGRRAETVIGKLLEAQCEQVSEVRTLGRPCHGLAGRGNPTFHDFYLQELSEDEEQYNTEKNKEKNNESSAYRRIVNMGEKSPPRAFTIFKHWSLMFFLTRTALKKNCFARII